MSHAGARGRPSLRAQAVAWLAQREHSERELRQKLQRRVRRDAALSVTGGPVNGEAGDVGELDGPVGAEAPTVDVDAEIDSVLHWLKDKGYLDDQRFIASRVHVRAAKSGTGRIAHELAQHGLQLPEALSQTLRQTEADRALALWQRRFGSPPTDARDAARQGRYLVGRGFSSEVVRRLMRHIARAPAPSDEDAA